MATALGLTPEESREFREVAHLAHAPAEVRSLVNRLRLDAAKDRGELIDLRSQIATLRKEMADNKTAFRALLSVIRERGVKLPDGFGNV